MVTFRSNLQINKLENDYPKQFKKPATLLRKQLTTKQQVWSNYLLPNFMTSLIYILNFTADLCLAIQLYRDDNYIFASITLFLTYVPAIGSIFFTFSNVNAWPDENCSCENVKWMLIKFGEHLLFPIWAMYRFAEQCFWSIEAYRGNDDEVEELLHNAERNSVFELYHFLQAYLQAAPQILFQLHIIFRQTSRFNKITVDMQVLCVILSLTKMAMTTASYQRFKSQKMAGRKYGWKKEPIIHTVQEAYTTLGSNSNLQETVQEETILSDYAGTTMLAEELEIKEPENIIEDKRHSGYETENSEPEADRQIAVVETSRRNSGLSETSSVFNINARKKSLHMRPDETDNDNDITQMHTRSNSDVSESSDSEENQLRKKHSNIVIPMKVVSYKGLPEDDSAGKLVSFFWWFCFIMPRMLCLSAFAYFYPTHIWWICGAHYIITLAFLLYDAHISDIPYYRAIFILFTAYVYMFCLIEFKIKFKKVKFIYNGYFLLVYLENLIMTSIWYFTIDFESDWWYKYLFYLICGSSLISVSSMMLYLMVLKPKKIILQQELRSSKVL